MAADGRIEPGDMLLEVGVACGRGLGCGLCLSFITTSFHLSPQMRHFYNSFLSFSI